MPEVDFKVIVADHGKVFAILVGVWDNAGDTMILANFWKDGGKFFNDTKTAGAVFGLTKVKISLIILKIEVVSAGARGVGGRLRPKNWQKRLTNYSKCDTIER